VRAYFSQKTQNYLLVKETAAIIESLGIRWIVVNGSREIGDSAVPQLEFSAGFSTIKVSISVAVVNMQQFIKVLYCRLPIPICRCHTTLYYTTVIAYITHSYQQQQ